MALSLSRIVTHFFSYRGLIADDVKYIIGNLKRNAQFTAVTARRMSLFGRGLGKNRAAFTGVQQQSSCFLFVENAQFFQRKFFSFAFQIEHLTARHACGIRLRRR